MGLPESCLDLVSECSWSDATSSGRWSSGSSQLQHSLLASVPEDHAADISGVSNSNHRMRYFSQVVFGFMRWILSLSFSTCPAPCGSWQGRCILSGSVHKEFKDIHPFYLQGMESSTYNQCSPLIQDGNTEYFCIDPVNIGIALWLPKAYIKLKYLYYEHLIMLSRGIQAIQGKAKTYFGNCYCLL